MRLRSKITALALLSAFMLALPGCENENAVVPEELTDGCWMETVTNGLLLSFDDEGNVFNYIYREHSQEGIYYACEDPSWSGIHYLMDADNHTLFITPDTWYDIRLLTYSAMRLSDGENGHEFKKLKEGKDISIVTAEEFEEMFPE